MATSASTLAVNCATCSRPLPYKEVKSDGNGNRGRWVAKCFNLNPTTGVRCKFWSWADGLPGSRTPSLSPPSSASVLSHEGRFQDLQILSQLPSNVLREACRALGCRSRRIRQKCTRQMCKKHCIEAGGCSDRPHFVLEATTLQGPSQPLPPHLNLPSQPPQSMLAFTPAVAPPLLSNSASDQHLLELPPSFSSQASHPSDSQSRQPYSSHMINVFNQQMAIEQKLQEERRQFQATQAEHTRKTKHTVTVYAWTEENADPNSFTFQEGFAWPYFEIDDHVLEVGIWTIVHLPYVVEVNEKAPSIFIKKFDLVTNKDLPHYAKFLNSPLSPNLRTNLAGERTYMRGRVTKYELEQLSPRAGRSKRRGQVDEDEESIEASPVKRQRLFLDPDPPRRVPGATTIRKKPSLRMSEVIELDDSDSDLELKSHTPYLLKDLPYIVKVKQEKFQPTLTSPATSQMTPTRPSTPIQSGSRKLWPADFYAIDIVKCFDEVSQSQGDKDSTVKDIFNHHFPAVKYARSTFYGHKNRWTDASIDAKQSILAAGYSLDGLWSVFMSENPDRRAEIKAARKRHATNVKDNHKVVDLT